MPTDLSIRKPTWEIRDCESIARLPPFEARSARRLEIHRTPQRIGIVKRSVCNHPANGANVTNIFQRIGVQDIEVRSLSTLDASAVGIDFHHLGGHNRSRLQSLHWREARLNVDLDLAVNGIAWDSLVSPCHEANPRAMKHPHNLQRLTPSEFRKRKG